MVSFVSLPVCYVTILSLQGFHCFSICLLRHCSVLGFDYLVFRLLRHHGFSSRFLLVHSLSVVMSMLCFGLRLSLNLCCYVTMLSTQGFHCFIICLLRHCSVLGVDCLFLCLLRHYAFSSRFPLFHYLFVTTICSSVCYVTFYSGYSASTSQLLLSGAPDTVGLHGCVGVWRRSPTGNCECRTCPRSLRD